ncbi:MAG TPA: proprotein convertase P-domain-containing protein [Saprospiraceae bacterium]|nr:proprotein convertase P-domain-containing protein [Saprospiraceae bacterium]HMQ85175.1 proprotein convertase P-domain-containing protein [Saprospiraceae bacterium]
MKSTSTKLLFSLVLLMFGWTGASLAQTYSSSDTPLAIPDLGTTSSSISVPLTGTIGTDYDVVSVAIDITHTWDADMDIFLIAPSGEMVELTSDNGGSGDNFTGTIFMDGGANGPITAGIAPFTGTYSPEQALTGGTLTGADVNGNWVLSVTDDASSDTGTLNSWSITFGPAAPPPACTPNTYPGTVIQAVLGPDPGGADGIATANVTGTGIIGVDAEIVNVTLDITHTWDADMDITLIAPDGVTTLELTSDNGGSGDNFTGTIFADGGGNITSGVAPFTGTFQPEGGTFAAAFAGVDVNGTWTLRVVDDAAGDGGTLNSFSISVCDNMVVLDNDLCADAFPIACGETASGTTADATFDNAGTCNFTNTAPGRWYRFTGDGSVVTIDTEGSSYDTKLSVYTGSCGSLVCEIGDDDGGSGLLSSLTIFSTLGVDYYILVHGFGSTTGAYNLNVACVTPPMDNDLCDFAEPIACNSSASGTTADATFDNAGTCNITNTAPGRWYVFTGTGGTVIADTEGSAYDTKLSVYTGSCGSLVCETGDDDGGTGLLSSLTFNSTLGTTYYILVHGFGSATGAYTLNVTCPMPPANDDACDAIALTLNVADTVNNLGATVQTGELDPGIGSGADPCDSQDGWCNFSGDGEPGLDNSVWFTFTPAADGCYAITTAASDLQLAVWTASDCNDFGTYVEVAANDDGNPGGGLFDPQVNTTLSAGVTYYIQVDGYAGLTVTNDMIIVTQSLNCPLDCQTDDEFVTLNLLTDNFGGETTWEVRTEGGQLVASGGPYPNATNIVETFCADPGCYVFTIFDSFGDGICCGFGIGNYSLTDPDGNVYNSPSNGAYGASETIEYCVCGVEITSIDVTDETCPDFEDGTISVSATGNVGNLSYSITGPAPANTVQSNGTGVFTDLAPGDYTVTATDDGVPNCSASQVVTVVAGDVLPEPWDFDDASPFALNSNGSFDPCTGTGVFTITTNGQDVGSSVDNHSMIFQELCGDGSITLRVESIDGPGYAGVEFRENFAADAQQVSMLSNLINVLRWDVRYTEGGLKQISSFYRPFPIYLRLVRQGDWFFGYYSADGVNFGYVHSVFVDMNECIYVGMAAMSYVNGATVSADFTDVVVTGGGGGGNLVAPDNIFTDVATDADRFEVGLYPNPTNANTNLKFNLSSELPATVRLMNSLGQVVLIEQLQSIPNGTVELTTERLAPGTYFVEIFSEEFGTSTLQLVKTGF